MEITTIQVSIELRNELNKLKYHYGYKTIEQVIRYYIKGGLENGNTKQIKKSVEEVKDEKSLS